MKKSKIQTWEELEGLFCYKYKYPGTNLPKNDLQEGIALQKFLPPFCDGIFLDYGCGEGVMLKYIKKYYKLFPPLIVAVDPDYSRLIRAKRLLLKKEGRGVFLNTTFNDLIFRKEKLQNSLSCIICVQVFGHIPEYGLINTLRTFYFLLESRGVLIIAIPFINSEFNFPKWKKGTDSFFLVNCLSNLQDPARKIIISPEKFSYFANHPKPNLLPTRRFYINEKAEIGHKCDHYKIMDSRLGKTIKKSGFIIKNAIVYRVKSEKGSGDLMISLLPSK